MIAELFSNFDGKTSASGFVGVLVGIVGCIAFLTATIGYVKGIPDSIEVMQQSSIFIGSAVALLAARKFSSRKFGHSQYEDSYENYQGDNSDNMYGGRRRSRTGDFSNINSFGDNISEKPSNNPDI